VWEGDVRIGELCVRIGVVEEMIKLRCLRHRVCGVRPGRVAWPCGSCSCYGLLCRATPRMYWQHATLLVTVVANMLVGVSVGVGDAVDRRRMSEADIRTKPRWRMHCTVWHGSVKIRDR